MCCSFGVASSLALLSAMRDTAKSEDVVSKSLNP